MKAQELMDELFALAPDGNYEQTVDTCKAGDPQKEIRKVAVTMFPTVEVVEQAAAWGADLCIVHEPTYFTNWDDHSDEQIEVEKRALIEKTGMTIFRYHDHSHYAPKDIIIQGVLEPLELEGKFQWRGEMHGPVRVTLNQPITPRELALLIEKRLNIKHVRICGAVDTPCRRISNCLGAPGNSIFDELKRPETEIVLAGEICEWSQGEYARDAARLGHAKALLVLGHVGSERDGMLFLARMIEKAHPELEVKYFDCGEVYCYPEDVVKTE